MADNKKKPVKRKDSIVIEKCDICGKDFEQTQLGGWSRIIHSEPLLCSFECREEYKKRKFQ